VCGIHLIVSKKELSNAPIAAMCQATRHRGVDGQGFYFKKWQDNYLYFAHNRLKIIDFSTAAAQPMHSEDENEVLVFNGEIYNAALLKKQLPNVIWRSQNSDTEVLLNWLKRYGTTRLDELEGMFAFIFWNKKEEKLIVARDRSGMKPLYVAHYENYLLFSSEIKAIHASGLVPIAWNKTAMQSYLQYKYASTPIFQYVEEISPAHVGQVIFQDMSLKTYRYVFAKQSYQEYDAHSIVRQVQKLLTQSVEKHLIADADIGLMLSGGVDSTLLLATLQRLGKNNFPCLSIQWQEKEWATEDFKYAEKAATQFGGELHPVLATPQLLHQYFEHIQYIDQPIADSAYCLTNIMAKKATQMGIKVLFSGAGADEWFAGYQRHAAYYQYLKYWKKFPWDWFKKTKPMLPDGKHHPLREKFRQMNRFMQKVENNPFQTFLNFTTLTGFSSEDFLVNTHQELDTLPENADLNDYLSFAFWHDIQHYLTQDVLSLTDKAAMQQGVEVRLPYLDVQLIAFMQTVLPEKRIYKGRKWILNYLLELYGGSLYTQRSKAGLGMPLAAWLRMPEFEYITAWHKQPHHPLFEVIRYEKALKLYAQHQNCQQDFSAEIWAISVLYHFMEKYRF
jgi:asparagine synthase (glutamine-hydrolysing)